MDVRYKCNLSLHDFLLTNELIVLAGGLSILAISGDQGTARISLTSVLTAAFLVSTQHVSSDGVMNIILPEHKST